MPKGLDFLLLCVDLAASQVKWSRTLAGEGLCSGYAAVSGFQSWLSVFSDAVLFALVLLAGKSYVGYFFCSFALVNECY